MTNSMVKLVADENNNVRPQPVELYDARVHMVCTLVRAAIQANSKSPEEMVNSKVVSSCVDLVTRIDEAAREKGWVSFYKNTPAKQP